MSAAPDAGQQPTGSEPEPPTVVWPPVRARHDGRGLAGEPPAAVSAETLLPGDGPSAPDVHDAGGEAAPAEATAQAGFAEPPAFVPTPSPAGEAPGAGGGFSGSSAGLLERRPELGLAAGFAGGFLLATILRRLGR